MKARWTMLAVFAALVVGMLTLGGMAWAQSSDDPNADSSVQTTQRSFDEWLAAQSTFCIPDGSGGCIFVIAPLPNMLGWEDPDTNRWAIVDYAGLANRYIEQQSSGSIDLGTNVTVPVTEQALNDGSAEMAVKLQFTDALTFVVACSDPSGPLVFGYRAEEVLAGATPSLADGTLTIKYTMGTAGAPLQDLIRVFFFPQVGTNVRYVHMHADSVGTLRAPSGYPDGTPGTLRIHQLGLFKPKTHSAEPFIVHPIDVEPQ